MARRIEIELTSARPDGTWTWRVAGARQPKGVLDGAILPASSKVGDILRADAEFELDGTVITAVVAPPEKRPPDLLALITDSRPFEGVTTSLVPKSPRRREWSEGGERRESRPRTDRPAGGRPGRERPSGREPREPGASREPGARDTGTGDRRDRPRRTERAERPEGTSRPDIAPGAFGAPGAAAGQATASSRRRQQLPQRGDGQPPARGACCR